MRPASTSLVDGSGCGFMRTVASSTILVGGASGCLPGSFAEKVARDIDYRKASSLFCAGFEICLNEDLDGLLAGRGGWVVLRPRGPRSGLSSAVSNRHHLIDPIRPTREHIAISPHGGLYALPSLCGTKSLIPPWVGPSTRSGTGGGWGQS